MDRKIKVSLQLLWFQPIWCVLLEIQKVKSNYKLYIWFLNNS